MQTCVHFSSFIVPLPFSYTYSSLVNRIEGRGSILTCWIRTPYSVTACLVSFAQKIKHTCYMFAGSSWAVDGDREIPSDWNVFSGALMANTRRTCSIDCVQFLDKCTQQCTEAAVWTSKCTTEHACAHCSHEHTHKNSVSLCLKLMNLTPPCTVLRAQLTVDRRPFFMWCSGWSFYPHN